MAHVKLFGRPYRLPTVTNNRFHRLQQRVNQHYQRIQDETGRARRVGRLSRLPFASLPPSPEDRFQALSRLIRDYHRLSNELRRSREAYRRFFAQLAAGVQQALADKQAEIRRLEQERRHSYQEAVARQDEALRQLALEDEVLLRQAVGLLGHSALLLLKKIAVCQEGLARLACDQEAQQRALAELTDHLDVHRHAYERRQRIDQVVREVAQMADIALDFEVYMRRHLGPLQEVIDRVTEIDTALHHAVTEIEDLTQRLGQPNAIGEPYTGSPEFTGFDQNVLDFLVAGRLKKERLAEVLEYLEHQPSADIDLDPALVSEGSASHPLLEALDHIDTLVGLRLSPLLTDGNRVTPVRLPTPEAMYNLSPVLSPEISKSRSWRGLVSAAARLIARVRSPADRLNLEFVFIKAGAFHMGSTVFDDERPIHDVRITQSFYLSKYPVTQAQWEAVMGYNTSHFQGHPRRPVEQVSWEAAQAFIHALNGLEGHENYRLPTEAEWEYAARANSADDYYFGPDAGLLRQHAWWEGNASGQTHPIGQLKANAWGLYDLYGNVWEWVQDWYDAAYYQGAPYRDPKGPATGLYRVARGGSWDCVAGDCRSASRNVSRPNASSHVIGFRLLRQV